MKEISKYKDSKKILINLYKLKRKFGYSFVRLVEDKESQMFFFAFHKESREVHVFDAISFKQVGRLSFSVKNNNDAKLAEIISVRIDYNLRKKGVGSQLMKFTEHVLKKEGFQQIELMSRKCKAIERWYRRLGYRLATDYSWSPNILYKTHLKYKRAKIEAVKDVLPVVTQQKLLKKLSLRKHIYKEEMERALD